MKHQVGGWLPLLSRLCVQTPVGAWKRCHGNWQTLQIRAHSVALWMVRVRDQHTSSTSSQIANDWAWRALWSPLPSLSCRPSVTTAQKRIPRVPPASCAPRPVRCRRAAAFLDSTVPAPCPPSGRRGAHPPGQRQPKVRRTWVLVKHPPSPREGGLDTK